MDSEPIWTPLEHQILRESLQFQGQNLLVAVSGGVDSMVLLKLLSRLKKFNLSVFHAHHGPSEDPQLRQFREKAQNLVEAFCHGLSIPFYLAAAQSELTSEQAQRNFRKQALSEVQKKINARTVVLAHHSDDLLETQILKLIRGTSLSKPVMSQFHNNEWRPFINISKSELQTYAQEMNVEFINDPSNTNSDYLRNWLRTDWLPALEDKCPGALKSLSRSLQLLQEVDKSLPEEIWLKSGDLSRPQFLTLDRSAQKRALALYGQRLGAKDFSQNHILEVLKHLDKAQSQHNFICAKMNWSCEPASITARPLL